MNELGQAFSHVIVTFDKTHHFITSEQNEKLKKVGNNQRLVFPNFILNSSAIAQVLTVDDFYTAFPDKRPSDLKEFVAPPVEIVPLDKQAERSEKSMRGLLAGILVYQETHGSSPALEAMLKPKLAKYEALYGKKMELTDADRAQCLDSFSELDKDNQPRVPCRPCLKDWKHPASVDVVSQFS